ncbi:MAG: hypothetical protein ACKPKO_47875, partial [Candidatus Fonsibacter sp.]
SSALTITRYYVRKEFIPTNGVDSIDKLDHKGLPPKTSFYSSLKQKTISEKEYERAKSVYDSLNCQSFKDYHLAYLKTDVLLLADVFEKFRATCYDYYNLDPSNYISAASLAWDAMLLKTKVKLELIHDVEMQKMIEKRKNEAAYVL